MSKTTKEQLTEWLSRNGFDIEKLGASETHPGIVEIGDINCHYGSLSTKVEGGKFYWSIENTPLSCWEEIPETLFKELIKFEFSGGVE